MIPLTRLWNSVKSLADDIGSNRYRFDSHGLPAINLMLGWVQAVGGRSFGKNSKVEEGFKELTYQRIFQANAYARIRMNEASLGHGVWTILGVFPEPDVIPANAPITIIADNDSLYRNDVSFDKSLHSAKRLTREQWEAASRNPFKPGNNLLSQAGMIEYAYLNSVDSSSGVYQPGGFEIEIRPRPNVAKKFVGIAYLRTHPEVTQLSDNLLFPDSMENLLTDKVWNYMNWKNGDGTTGYAVTAKDIAELAASVL